MSTPAPTNPDHGPTTVNPYPPTGMTIPACEPTEDPDWWRMIEDCDDTCHHPVHAFGSKGRRKHLIPKQDAVRFAHEHLRGTDT